MDLEFLTDDPIDDVRPTFAYNKVDLEDVHAESNLTTLDDVPTLARHLPYSCLTNAEYEQLMQDTVDQVCHCIMSGEWVQALLSWCTRVQELLVLKYSLSRPLRAQMARLFYELAVIPTLDGQLTEMAASVCIKLLRPKRVLDISDLTLPWRPLFDVLQHEVHHKQRRISARSVSPGLLDLSEYAQRFYPEEETPSMLEAILPQMDGNDLNVRVR